MDAYKIVPALIRKHAGLDDLHITRVLCCWVVVSNGEVVEVDHTNTLHKCPLQTMLSKLSVEEYAQEKIREFGHFTGTRPIVRPSIAVPYGTSEMLMYGLNKGVIDCAITVCDGAGTVITNDPEVVQGIGARMNGLFHTSAIPETQARLRERGCTIFEDAAIDQVRGLRKAVELGFRKIAVTVNTCYGDSFKELRKTAAEAGVELTIAALCSTGATLDRCEEAVDNADLGWSCASKYMRELGNHAILQLTHGIPIFVYTRRGLDIIAAYSDEEGARIIRSLDTEKQYMLASQKGETMIMLGNNKLSLSETPLPVEGKNGPSPLK